MKLYLAVDLGTTGCRSIIFDDKLNQISSAYEEYSLIIDKEGFAEQDADLWWELTLRTAISAISASNVPKSEIRGISVSSQGISIVPVDENCNPLCNSISWLDIRATKEAKQFERDFGENEIISLTGKPCSEVYTLPKLLWLKNNKPEIYKKAYKFLMPLDFLTAKFTGEYITDHSMASGTAMYDLKNARWCQEILDFYSIDIKKLPNISYTGEKAGVILPEIREKLGLREDCVFAVGAQDQKSAAYGVGLDEDSITISLGTAAAVTKCSRNIESNRMKNVTWCGYTNSGVWVAEGVVSTAGTCLRWIRDTFYKGEDYSIINSEAEKALKNGTSLMFFPFMNGGADGEQGTFYSVDLSKTRGDFALAVMEGVAFEIRTLLENINAYERKRKIILFGGAARSELWCRIISNITKMDVLIPITEEAASAGAARAAAKAMGTDISPLLCNKSYKPNKDYEEKYEKYKEIRTKLWRNLL